MAHSKKVRAARVAKELRSYDVDVVHCIDTCPSGFEKNGSALALMKLFATSIHDRVIETGSELRSHRLRFIFFGDCWSDAESRIFGTRFISFPKEWSSFEAFITDKSPVQNASQARNGLEAVGIGIKSQWATGGDKGRRVLMVWSNAAAHPLERAQAESPPLFYPTGEFPHDFARMTDVWSEVMARNYGSIVLLAPDVYPWCAISREWPNAIHFPSAGGTGITKEEADTIIRKTVLDFEQ